MASFSIENLRKLNQFHLMAINIKPKAGAVWSDEQGENGDTQFKHPSGQTPWRVSFYASNGVTLDGSIQTTDPLGSIANSIMSNKVIHAAASVATAIVGIAPQIDIARKFLYSGVNALEFTLSGCLALETDVQTDYYTPIDKLAYLTYPDRMGEFKIDDVFKGLDLAGQKWFGAKKNLSTTIKNTIGGLYQNVFGEAKLDSKGNQTEQSKSEGWSEVEKIFNNAVGKAYYMSAPPTFMWTKSGSGLDFRYGKVLISDVYIKSFKIEYPTLYYDEGLPALIPVTLSLGTFRPLSATMMSLIMQGHAQQWSSSNGTGDTFGSRVEKSKTTDINR